MAVCRTRRTKTNHIRRMDGSVLCVFRYAIGCVWWLLLYDHFAILNQFPSTMRFSMLMLWCIASPIVYSLPTTYICMRVRAEWERECVCVCDILELCCAVNPFSCVFVCGAVGMFARVHVAVCVASGALACHVFIICTKFCWVCMRITRSHGHNRWSDSTEVTLLFAFSPVSVFSVVLCCRSSGKYSPVWAKISRTNGVCFFHSVRVRTYSSVVVFYYPFTIHTIHLYKYKIYIYIYIA